ncbi:MAG: FecR domain-containing protein, partial [Deltaproteobacteria bacterium]|nr:FecR domain-containing protein [Deltaproteobacteria bacterium]
MTGIRKKIHFFLSLTILFTLILLPFSVNGNPGELPAELQGIEIGPVYTPSQFKDVGVVETLGGRGKLIVLRRAAQAAYYAKEGDSLHEKDTLFTAADCRCRLRFKDKNLVIMAPQTTLDIEHVYASLFKGEKKSVFKMVRGRAIFYAIRLFRYKTMRLDLVTPTASIGVRGTKFGAEIEQRTEGQSHFPKNMLASRSIVISQAGAGMENLLTRAYVFEGEVTVTALVDGNTQILRLNEILEIDRRGLGDVVLDPGRTKSFIEQVISGLVSEPEPGKRMFEERIH